MSAQLKLVIAYAPLVLFSLAGHLGGPSLVGWFALAAALATGLILVDQRAWGVNSHGLASMVILTTYAAIALLGGPAGQSWVATYGFITLHLLIGVVMLVSAVTVPFTERIARMSVPRQYWGSPTFKAVNRKLSAVWGVAVLGGGLSRCLLLVLERGTDTPPVGGLGIVLMWIVPVALIITAYRITKATSAGVHHHIEAAPSVAPTQTH